MSANPWRVFVVAGLVALGATWLVQLVLLPLVLPGWAHPSGLLAGHDSVGFHRVAEEQALLIESEGWAAWELRPNQWGISGLMSAWYVWFGPHPESWGLVQAMLYGLAVMLLFSIMFRITSDRVLAVFSILPALLLPSTMVLYVFPHRDVFVFFGLMLLMYGFVRISTLEWIDKKNYCFWIVLWSGLVMSGYFVAGVVRTFTAELFLGISGIVFLILFFRAGFHIFRQRSANNGVFLSPVAVLVLISIMVGVDTGGYFDKELKPVVTPQSTQSVEAAGTGEEVSDTGWKRAGWLPKALDDRLRRLAGARDHLLEDFGHGRSVIDAEVQFRSATDVLAYLPRALQIGIFAPFPEFWKPHPEAPASRNVERVVVGVEMALLYVVLPFALYTVWLHGRKLQLWLAFLPVVGWVLVYAATVPVVGALVRYRYGAYLLIIAIAMAGLGEAIRRIRSRSHRLTL
jgi:hypothetical protein